MLVHYKRVIDNEIKKALSRELLFGKLKNGGVLNIDYNAKDNQLHLECEEDAVLVEV